MSSDLLDALRASGLLPPRGPLDRVPPALDRALRSRETIVGWWHADDIGSAIDVLAESLSGIGVAGFPRERFEAWVDQAGGGIEEDDLRRHQIGFAATFASGELARAGDARRVRAMGRVLERELGEPAWFVLDPDEHAALIVLAGPPRALERRYDGRDDLDALSPPAPVPLELTELSPSEAWERARDAARRSAWDEALPLLRVMEGQKLDLLGELLRLEILRGAGHTEEACAAWVATADGWLAGTQVWRSQWRRLIALHTALKLPDDGRLARVKAALALAPE